MGDEINVWQWLRFHLVPGLGRRGLERLYTSYGSLEAMCGDSPRLLALRSGVERKLLEQLPVADGDWLRLRDRLIAQGVRLLSYWDSDYPQALAQIHDPPILLYLRGSLPQGQRLAVVGARRASDAGRQWTERFCCDLARAGVAVVSGLARGIDTAAHEGVLQGEGATWAVLGCGIDRLYPAENVELAVQMEKAGGILSEYPPGTPPLPGHFPRRNRVISGLSLGVLVVEAAENSGSLITADFALEQGREVFAVPGAVYHPHGAGPNRLIKQGAQPVTDIEDILLAFGGLPQEKNAAPEPLHLNERERKVLENLGAEPLECDEIARRCGLTPQELSDILLHLELSGGVTQYPGMRFAKSLTY